MGKMNVAFAKEKAKEVKDKTGSNFFKPAEGENIIRIGPPWGNRDWPFIEIEQHAAKRGGKEKGNDRFFTCPYSRGASACFTCDVVIPKLKAGNEDEQKIADSLSPQLSVACNVIDRSNENKGWQTWSFSYFKRYNELLAIINDPDYGDITDPEDGVDLTLNRKGTDRDNTTYSLHPKRKSSPLDPSGKGFAEKVPDLEEFFKGASEKDQRKIINDVFGLVFEGDDDLNDTEAPPEDAGDEAPPEETGEAPVEEVAPDELADDDKRIPITVSEALPQAKQKIAVNAGIKASECFGKFFNEQSQVCELCAANLDCASEMDKGQTPKIPPAGKATPPPAKTTTPPTRTAPPPPSQGSGARVRGPQRRA